MAIFNDVNPFGEKLCFILNRLNLMVLCQFLKKEDAVFIEHANTEPLREECAHFLDCIQSRNNHLTDAQSGIEVLKVCMLAKKALNKMVLQLLYERSKFKI